MLKIYLYSRALVFVENNDDCVCLVALLEGDLSEVEALRDVKADLLSKKEVHIISYQFNMQVM